MGADSFSLMLRRSFMIEKPEEEEEEEEDGEAWARAEEICASCGDHLHYTEEVVQMQICQAVLGPEGINFCPIFNADGDFHCEPRFLEFDCWESLVKDLKEVVEDMPPVGHRKRFLECTYCKSAILEFEIFATTHVGELRVSRRCPNGVATAFFETMGEPYITCLGCLTYQRYELDLWEEDLNQIGECEECTHSRCWRYTDCPCPCHSEGNADETT